jgi:hypothetical protein
MAGASSVARVAMAAAVIFALFPPEATSQIQERRVCPVPARTAPPAGVAVESGTAERGGSPTRFVPLGVPPAALPAAPSTPIASAPEPPVTSAPTTPVASQPPPQTGGGGGTPAPAVPGLPPAPKEDDRKRVEARQAQGHVPEERLVDVGIELFDPGSTESDAHKLAKVGLSLELRRSEARFMAFQLKKTLEGTGFWGAVRVLPGPGEGVDVSVSGRIRESNGKRLILDIEARDARGEKWFEKRYRGQADLSAYRPERVGQQEAFQDVYNRIANDLLEALEDRKDAELALVRQIAGLRFAAELVPEAFAPYLKSSGSGRYTLKRLPAADDPMARRVASIRERDHMLLDALNDQYLAFNEKMGLPYANWKMYSYEEQDAIDRIRKESLLKKILGGAALLGGMLMTPDNYGEAAVRDAAILGGSLVMQSGFAKGQEVGVHKAALKELAMSFDADVQPMLVEVEGQQLKLTGPAEVQFAAWRDLLRQVLSVETGDPIDPNTLAVATPGAKR